MKLHNLYLKWHAFSRLINLVDTDSDVGRLIFQTDDGNERFAKLIRGDRGLEPEIATVLAGYIDGRINASISRAKGAVKTAANRAAIIKASDLVLPTFAFIGKIVEAMPDLPAERLQHAHRELMQDLTAPRRAQDAVCALNVERYETQRSFGAFKPSGGAGPVVFVAGKHKGQLAVIGATREPLAAYTVLARDPAPVGKHLWDLAWGEAVLWLPSPSKPVFTDNRLLLMPQAEPVLPIPGRFCITTALVWREDACNKLQEELKSVPGVFGEAETSWFFTCLRRFTIEDKRKKWIDAVTVLGAEYFVEA